MKGTGKSKKSPGPRRLPAGLAKDTVRYNGKQHWTVKGDQPLTVSSVFKEDSVFVQNPLLLVGNQKSQLLALIQEREAILTSKASNPHLPGMRAKAWSENTAKFNVCDAGHEPRTTKQRKRSWDHIKRKIKTNDLAHRKKVCKTGGGAPPPQPKFSDEEEMARVLMSQDLAMPSQAKELGQLHPLEQQGNLGLDVFINYEGQGTSTALPRPTPMSSKKTGNMAVVLDDFSQRGKELHQKQMKVEEARLVTEKAKMDAFLPSDCCLLQEP
ncbi:hypothetical protein O3P69_018147 [Scylla paramamosain]|uniref:Regulatory protein zeste n=1 Tax=Scylla paramamosain TaxID=85552 RepID=A0AAW0TLV9_SCYPA